MVAFRQVLVELDGVANDIDSALHGVLDQRLTGWLHVKVNENWKRRAWHTTRCVYVCSDKIRAKMGF